MTNQLHVKLDAMTDAAIPATKTALVPFVKMTIEDKEALSDWLQDRFHSRIQKSLESTS